MVLNILKSFFFVFLFTCPKSKGYALFYKLKLFYSRKQNNISILKIPIEIWFLLKTHYMLENPIYHIYTVYIYIQFKNPHGFDLFK